jgi:hypothetical protein
MFWKYRVYEIRVRHDDTRRYTTIHVLPIQQYICPDQPRLPYTFIQNHKLVVLQMFGVIVYLCDSGVGKPERSHSANRRGGADLISN